MRKSTEKYSQSAHRKNFFKTNIVKKPSLLIKKHFASQNTINCPEHGDVYEDPITKGGIRCGKCSEWL